MVKYHPPLGANSQVDNIFRIRIPQAGKLFPLKCINLDEIQIQDLDTANTEEGNYLKHIKVLQHRGVPHF